MKYFIVALIFLVGCGTEPEPTFKPYQIGTWLVTSETEAEWIGSDAKYKADTLVVGYPDSISLNIRADSVYDHVVNLTFTDSTMQALSNPTHTSGIFFDDSSGLVGGKNLRILADSARVTIRTNIAYRAGSRDPEYMYVKYDTVRVYNLYVVGIKDAIVDILNIN